jgi:cell division protein FtsZ
LGGELGSFLIPALAARAKAHGITTIASVGIPFSFEGRQKKESADAALRKLHDLCDAVAVIDNDRLSGGVPSSAAVGEAFVAADRALQSSLMALRGMLLTSGPVRITRHDLMTTLGTHGAMTHFAHGRASGANRLHEALEQALKSTLLLLPGKGPVLREASSVLVLLSGPSDLSFAEVQRAVSEVERLSMERCQVKVGVRAESSPEAPLEIFLLTSSGGTPRIPEAPANGTPRHLERKPEEISPGEKFAATARSSKTSKPGGTTAVKQTQGVLDLESYQRGRFDKSEPTIVAGEDLDIPTFFRKGIKLPAPSKH